MRIYPAMKLNPQIIALLFFLSVPSCIDPIDFSKADDSKRLVVDGLITNESGPYVVQLASTTAYNSPGSISGIVKGAIVVISDDAGNSEVLKETYISGVYKTDPEGIRGIPGRYYKVEIETPDGKQYVSNPELLNAVPQIDTVYYERQQQQELDENNIAHSYEGFQIYFDASDPTDINNYYLSSWAGIHEVHTQPWLFFDIEKRVTAPKDCCATCWKTDRPNYLDTFDDTYSDGSKILKRPVTFVRIINSNGARHFRGKYHVEVKQLSLTREAFQYWSSIEEQMNATGSIFDPPPSAISGNIISVNDPENTAFGYFGASAIATKSVTIPEQEAPYPFSDTLYYPDDCRLMGNSTPERPSFW